MTLPAWLKDRIGAPAPRNAAHRRCRTCKAATLVGLDADRCAFQATTDTTPLTPLGEALALLDGRTTYQLRTTPTSVALTRRTGRNITANKASDECVVVAEHKCFTPPLPQLTIRAATKKKGNADDKPPF